MRDLDLTVETGQVYGLLGPNGFGKSTTLKIILGLVAATRGSTEIFGRHSREVASRNAVGFLPESPYFYKYLTGAKTLRFHGKLCGLGGSRLKRRVGELHELVGLTSAHDRRLGDYSKGMLQRIGLAQAPASRSLENWAMRKQWSIKKHWMRSCETLRRFTKRKKELSSNWAWIT